MSKRDYYEVLGVARTSDAADLKKAYRRMANKYHPDKNAGDPEAEAKFKEVKEAYDVLSDPEKRQAYDSHGHAAFEQGGFGAAGGHGNVNDIFEDIFGDIFGGGAARSSSRRGFGQPGADLRYGLTVTLEEAVFGAQKQVRIPTYTACGDCDGSGARRGSKPTECPACSGVGQIRMQQGFFSVQQTCPQCRGAGQVIASPCQSCHGEGRVRGQASLKVKIPAGVDDGDRIRLAGKGEAGVHGGPPGDLYVQIRLAEHPIFKREDQNLYCEVPVSFTQAALGGEVEVPTLEGRVKLKVPPGSQTGKQFRLRGKGVAHVRGSGRGDLFCHIHVETPVNLTKQQKECLEELDRSLAQNREKHSPQSVSWLNRAKKFFEEMRF